MQFSRITGGQITRYYVNGRRVKPSQYEFMQTLARIKGQNEYCHALQTMPNGRQRHTFHIN